MWIAVAELFRDSFWVQHYIISLGKISSRRTELLFFIPGTNWRVLEAHRCEHCRVEHLSDSGLIRCLLDPHPCSEDILAAGRNTSHVLAGHRSLPLPGRVQFGSSAESLAAPGPSMLLQSFGRSR